MKKYFSALGKRDFWNGLIVFVLTATLYGLQEWLPLADGIHPVIKAALAAIVGYLAKNLFTPEEAKEKAAIKVLENSRSAMVRDMPDKIIINKTANKAKY